MKQGGAIRADDTDPQERGVVHVVAKVNETERPARMRSCNDAKQFMDRHENQSTASTNESLSEANCVNTSVMGDSWDKEPEDWVEEMRIVVAEAKKTRLWKEHLRNPQDKKNVPVMQHGIWREIFKLKTEDKVTFYSLVVSKKHRRTHVCG